MADKYVYQVELRGLEKIYEQLSQFRSRLEQITTQGGGPTTARFGREFELAFGKATDKVTRLKSEIRLLQQALAKPRFNLSKQIGAASGVEGTGRFAKKDERARVELALQQRINQLATERIGIADLITSAEERLVAARQRDANLASYTNRLEQQRLQLIRQLEDRKPGGSRLNTLASEREVNLLQRRAELVEQLAQEQQKFAASVPQQGRKILADEVKLSNQLVAARKAVRQAEEGVLAARTRAAGLGLAELDDKKGTATEEQRTVALARQLEIKAQLAEAANRESAAQAALKSVELERTANAAKLAGIEQKGGAAIGATEILTRIRAINDAYAQLIGNQRDAIRGLVGEDYAERLTEIQQRLESFGNVDLLDDDAAQEFAKVSAEAENLIQKIEQVPKQGIPLRLNDDELFAGLGLFERTMLGAARDIGRRFTATLQFAISGAILFGAQRLVREFLQAAIEVERSFADIGTSLEFDIEAPRGTAEFNRALEGIRFQTLQIANDFSVLPSEVNKAAFQMISRFSDVDAALTATRAQILATRVATIDQSEALRALTAVAESYGLAYANIGNEQERQRKQAELYATALDYATVIQQKFGVSVEDTIEGSAGLAELFRGMGFSLEQTFAIIAATVRKTAVTGATAFDRIGRSFGQLTNPQVRDQLLDLAAAWDEFNLAPSAFFDSGEQAFTEILAQYQSLPETLQRQIDQIIGQRRETQFVSAVLNSGELVQEILDSMGDSAGSAENRVRVLLATVQGTIEGISTQFQSLAQNLERLGVITPIKLLLRLLEGTLLLVNKITEGIGRLVNILDAVRIPGTEIGLDDVLKTTVSLFTAWLGIKKLLQGLQFVASVQGTGTLLKTARQLFSPTGGGGKGQQVIPGLEVASLGIVGARLDKASNAVKAFGKGVGTFFLRPMATMDNALIRISRSSSRLAATLSVATVATTAAEAAENKYTLAKIRNTLLYGIGALRNLGFQGLFTTAIGFLKQLSVWAAGFARVGFSLLGATAIITTLVRILAGIPSAIASGGSRESQVAKRTEELLEEAELAGQPLTEMEARLNSVREAIKKLNSDLDDAESSFLDTALTFAGGFVSQVSPIDRADLPGTDENLLRNRAQLVSEELGLMLSGYVEELNRLSRADDGTPEAEAALNDARRRIRHLFDTISGLSTEGMKNPSYKDLLAVNAALEQLREEGMPGIDNMLNILEETIFGFSTGSLSDIGDRLTAISQLQQLGQMTPAQARTAIEGAREDAQSYLNQALAAREPDQGAIDDANATLRQIALADLANFQQERDFRLQYTSAITDNREKVRAEIHELGLLLEIAVARGYGSGIQQLYKNEIGDKYRELAELDKQEALARFQFAVDSAKGLSEQIEALSQLRAAVYAQIIGRVGLVRFITGAYKATVEEERALWDVTNQLADSYEQLAVLREKNKILMEASVYNEVAGIAANIAALRVERAFLVDRGAEIEVLQAKDLEIRDAINQLREAEAARRFSFYKLTAGAGDQIKSTQADLLGAQKTLKGIIAAGGEDTKAAYDAQVEINDAQHALSQLALQLADLQARNASDLSDSLAQADLDIQAAQAALKAAVGALEKEAAQKAYNEAVLKGEKEYYDRRLDDLNFLYQMDQIGRSQYIAALRQVQSGINRATDQGEDLWRQIELQIRGLVDATEQAFNIPVDIRLPTLFEVRRALAADTLGVNYHDNRQQDISIYVSDDVDIGRVVEAINQSFGSNIDVEATRQAAGGAGITIGGFN